MRKAVKLMELADGTYVEYIYRVASININKVTLEKYKIVSMSNFDNVDVATITDSKENSTLVGTVILKMNFKVIDELSTKVDTLLSFITINKSELVEFYTIGIEEIKL